MFLCVLPFVLQPDIPSWSETCLWSLVISVCGVGGGEASDFALYHTAFPSLIVWFHLSGLTCSCRPHKLTCLPSLWTLALVGRANNTISFCTNYLVPTTGPASQLFSIHSHACTRMETNARGERERDFWRTHECIAEKLWAFGNWILQIPGRKLLKTITIARNAVFNGGKISHGQQIYLVVC